MKVKEVFFYLINPALLAGFVSHDLGIHLHAMNRDETIVICAFWAMSIGFFYWLYEQEVKSEAERNKARIQANRSEFRMKIAEAHENMRSQISRQEELQYRQARMWTRVDRWRDEITGSSL